MTGNQKKIIVVDDNVENLTAIKNTLKDLYEVYPSPSALKMFELLEHITPDLILLDVEMPDMNGYQAAKKLKSDDKFREIPIIFLTSMNDAESEMNGLNIGAVDYIHKPFVAHLLLRRIKTHLSLVEHKLEAENASRAKGEFLSRMSHEIRSPLNAVIGMINLASGENDTQTIKGYLEKAGSASKYVLGVINDILDMSKIEENKLELSCGEFNFKKMLENVIDLAGVRAGEKHQQITLNVKENVPLFLIGDELRLSQVITNLLTNAVKFTPEKGSVALNVEKIDDTNGELTLKIEVADSGIGISEEQQKRLFTSYSQADSSISKNFGGTGLGLVISKRIVELMQGKIWIESELNKGAKFIFTIKVRKGTENEGKVSSGESSEAEFDFSKHTILVAEDMEFNREVLGKYLEKTGLSVDFAKNGKEAVSMFRESPDKYSLILMDVHMPEMDGHEATRTIRPLEIPRAKDIPIIAMTADAFKEDIDKCFAAGMVDHISKPVVPKKMYAKLKEYLG